MIKRFILYGIIGWCLEIIWTGFWELISLNLDLIGHTSIWMFFIYGSGGLLFEPIHNKIIHLGKGARGLIWMYLIFVIEFITGFALSVFNIFAWHYDNMFSIMGFIRLDYAPLWFFVGLMYERVHIICKRFSLVEV